MGALCEREEELLELLGRHWRCVSISEALLESGGDDLESGTIKGLGHGGELGNDIGTGARVLDHGDNAIKLPPSSLEPRQHVLVDLRIQVHHPSLGHTPIGIGILAGITSQIAWRSE